MAKEIKFGGMRYAKYSVERSENFDGKLEIKPNINLLAISKFKSETSKQESLKIDFRFEVSYGKLGSLNLEGKIFLIVDSKTLKDTITGWEEKNLDKEMQLIIINLIMQKCSIKALQFEEDIGLPPHIQLPRLQMQPENSK